MFRKRVGEPCPQCRTPLQRRRSSFQAIEGDIAYCAQCAASYQLVKEEQDEHAKAAPAHC